jgi:hypothetical protein
MGNYRRTDFFIGIDGLSGADDLLCSRQRKRKIKQKSSR